MTSITCILGEDRLSEAEVRMSVTEPIRKGSMRCTNTALANQVFTFLTRDSLSLSSS